jgi:hypothetical protein
MAMFGVELNVYSLLVLEVKFGQEQHVFVQQDLILMVQCAYNALTVKNGILRF